MVHLSHQISRLNLSGNFSIRGIEDGFRRNPLRCLAISLRKALDWDVGLLRSIDFVTAERRLSMATNPSNRQPSVLASEYC
jgi:hypothetical protein